jgi:hypothetical protein
VKIRADSVIRPLIAIKQLQQRIQCLAGPCWACTAVVFLFWAELEGHDSFLRPDEFAPRSAGPLTVHVFNGTFDESVDAIAETSVEGVRLLGPEGGMRMQPVEWTKGEAGSKAWRGVQKLQSYIGAVDHRRTSRFEVELPEPGAYALGVDLHTSRVALSPEKFTAYLKETGQEDSHLLKILTGEPGQIIREAYTKTLKSFLTVGDTADPSRTFGQALGQSAEIVPLQMTGRFRSGQAVEFVALVGDQPVAGQVVLAGRREGFLNSGDEDHLKRVTDESGRFTLVFDRPGEWWIKFTRIIPTGPGEPMDLATQWATLTLEVPK